MSEPSPKLDPVNSAAWLEWRPAAKIFISYRRSDTQMTAGRLREWLVKRFGKRAIFRDKDSIKAADDWKTEIQTALNSKVIVLALIGSNWLTARDDTGHRRIDDPEDLVRLELELAFARRASVIPILVEEVEMPRGVDLPQSLKKLPDYSALRLRDDDWDAHMKQIERAINALDLKGYILRLVLRPLIATVAVIAATYIFLYSDKKVRLVGYYEVILGPQGGCALQRNGPAQPPNSMSPNLARIEPLGDGRLLAFNECGFEATTTYAGPNDTKMYGDKYVRFDFRGDTVTITHPGENRWVKVDTGFIGSLEQAACYWTGWLALCHLASPEDP
jgi:hypothetical protein